MELSPTKPRPMSEDDYLDLVTRLQQAMAVEPFRPSVIDVMRLAAEWRVLTTERDKLRAALVQIENWAGKLPSNMGEAALILQYIRVTLRRTW